MGGLVPRPLRQPGERIFVSLPEPAIRGSGVGSAAVRLASTRGDPPRAPSEWAESWQRSWDRLHEVLVPDRERQISVLLDVVEAMAGTAPTVIDLACGPGTITCRLLDRLPRAHSIAVDVDPVLLTIASATFANDDRVRVVRADLRDPGWGDALPESQVDAVLTATALH